MCRVDIVILLLITTYFHTLVKAAKSRHNHINMLHTASVMQEREKMRVNGEIFSPKYFPNFSVEICRDVNNLTEILLLSPNFMQQ